MKRLLAVLMLAAFIGLSLGGSYSYAGEVDILLQKLVEKGVLTGGEAQEIKVQTQEQVKKEVAQGKSESLPKWIQTTKLSGDLRIRYQGETKTGSKHRDRGRFRLRYGFDTKPNDQMKIGFKMATGEVKTGNGPEQTSTNQTFTNTFQNKNIWVDRAFIEYTPFNKSDIFMLKDMKLTAGKFANPFYTSEVVWDGDVNPEGGVVSFTPKIGGLKTFMTFGFLPLGEGSSDSNDPKLYAGQVGIEPKIFGNSAKLAAALYSYDDIKGMAWNTYSSNYTPTINNTLVGTDLKYDYDIVEVNGEYTPFEVSLLGKTMPVKLAGTWVSNEATRSAGETKAWMAGFKVGKASDPGSYEFFYNFREIGQDAVYALVNDSDFHLGGTGSKGHKFGLTYAVSPNSTLGCNYIISDPYKAAASGTSRHIDVYQVDWVTKF